MEYRINTYNKNYIMVDIVDILTLNDLEKLSNTRYEITQKIYFAWLELLEKNNNIVETYDIAFNRDNPLKSHLTTKIHNKKESDKHIYLFQDEEFKQIDVTSKIKTRRKIK